MRRPRRRWFRVRSVPSSPPPPMLEGESLSTQSNPDGERGTRCNSHTDQRLVHTLHDGQRANTTKTRNEDHSNRPLIAMDYVFMKHNSAASSQSFAEESVTCTAVKEDRHQHILSSVVLLKDVEEPRAIDERVVKFINSSVCRAVTLKTDTEPVIIACRNRVAEECRTEVIFENAVKGDKQTIGLS